ncbi:MAG: ABC transporter substrate-binding protein [Acidimicrobiia bacterium]|nr:ABC transporter substrate-binding protein [Acidimicrobiia bacterium]MYC44240.1 ABC transporter substrate-binding protein [Acidimicrobiia bacterium]
MGFTLLAVALLAAACGGDGDTTPAAAEDDRADGSLGIVEVAEGDAIQIRSLNAITGDVAWLGLANQRGVELAIGDFGPIHGFDVELGAGLDEFCSSDGGQAAAQTIVADSDVVGVIGTSCSVAATAAAPLITGAGLAMIAPSNTSPLLTSDLEGNPGVNYNVGYYRTSNNGLVVGEAMARFVHDELGLDTAAALHDGDPYSQSIAQAFADSFEILGGTVTIFTAVNKEDSDMLPVLTEVATGGPEALFFPIFQPAGDFLAEQVHSVAGLEDIVLLTDAALLVDGFMSLPQSEGIYFSGPDLRFGGSANESTGRNAADLLTIFEETYGEPPSGPYWGHSYDATTLLLEAIKASSRLDDGTLVIDRAGVREHLYSVRDYGGIIGSISCDGFGDCGSQKVTVILHLDADDIEASKNNIVFEFAP